MILTGNAKGGAVVYRERTAASIPSKFETVLHMGPREKNGFWGRTLRFTESDNELPGPGAYAAATSSFENNSESFSKKGYGNGFVSKTKRASPAIRTRAPGPGQYDLVGIRPTRENDFNRAAATSSFAPGKQVSSLGGRKTTDVPGPGQYNVGEATTFTEHTKAKTIGTSKPFNTTGAQLSSVAKATAMLPAPGAYEQRGMAEQLSALPSSAFCSGATRPWEPPVESAQAQALRGIEHPAIKPQQIGYRKDKAQATPGPGTYEPKIDIETFKGAPTSSMFDPHLDRMGNSVRPNRKKKMEPPPGPGHYHENIHDRQDEPVLVSSSFFMSNVARIRGPDPELLPPGPAYYNPDNVSKKSFHLNARQRWL